MAVSSDGSLVSVDDTGWGLVSSDMRVGSNWELTDITKVGEHEVLFWRNLVSGVVAFWRLNADNKLLDELQGSGWGYVAEGVDLTKGWVLGGIVEINGATTMVWRNEDAGQVAFWRINATNCTMQDLQKGSGWGLVSDQVKVPSNWKLRAVVVVAEQPLLLWQNSANGAIAYWKLTADGELADHVEGSGWGLVQMDPPPDTGLRAGRSHGSEPALAGFFAAYTNRRRISCHAGSAATCDHDDKHPDADRGGRLRPGGPGPAYGRILDPAGHPEQLEVSPGPEP